MSLYVYFKRNFRTRILHSVIRVDTLKVSLSDTHLSPAESFAKVIQIAKARTKQYSQDDYGILESSLSHSHSEGLKDLTLETTFNLLHFLDSYRLARPVSNQVKTSELYQALIKKLSLEVEKELIETSPSLDGFVFTAKSLDSLGFVCQNDLIVVLNRLFRRYALKLLELGMLDGCLSLIHGFADPKTVQALFHLEAYHGFDLKNRKERGIIAKCAKVLAEVKKSSDDFISKARNILVSPIYPEDIPMARHVLLEAKRLLGHSTDVESVADLIRIESMLFLLSKPDNFDKVGVERLVNKYLSTVDPNNFDKDVVASAIKLLKLVKSDLDVGKFQVMLENASFSRDKLSLNANSASVASNEASNEKDLTREKASNEEKATNEKQLTREAATNEEKAINEKDLTCTKPSDSVKEEDLNSDLIRLSVNRRLGYLCDMIFNERWSGVDSKGVYEEEALRLAGLVVNFEAIRPVPEGGIPKTLVRKIANKYQQ